jgi:hypothetical protein
MYTYILYIIYVYIHRSRHLPKERLMEHMMIDGHVGKVERFFSRKMLWKVIEG